MTITLWAIGINVQYPVTYVPLTCDDGVAFALRLRKPITLAFYAVRIGVKVQTPVQSVRLHSSDRSLCYAVRFRSPLTCSVDVE